MIFLEVHGDRSDSWRLENSCHNTLIEKALSDDKYRNRKSVTLT